MTITLYYMCESTPCHAVMFTAKILGIKLNLEVVDLDKEEQLKPEFLKLNPQHTIPTLNDNGFVIWESKAIMIYLVEKYGNGSSLYPSDAETKAIVNQRLFFDLGTLYQRFATAYYPLWFLYTPVEAEAVKKLEEAFVWLDGFLSNAEYVAGNTLTLADISIVSSVSVVEVFRFDIAKYENVVRWFEKMKSIPAYAEAIGKGISVLREHLLLNKIIE